MHPFIEYLIKANALLIFFGIFYLIFLRKETFYQLNRWYFIGSILVSITAPLITYTKTILIDPISSDFFISDKDSVINEVLEKPSFIETIDWQQIAVYLILFTSFVLLIRRMYAIAKLYRSIKKLPNFGNSNIKISEVNKTVYSFYRWIVVPENFFKWKNHRMILDHERIHLSQKHTFDLILIELVAAVFWFNPLVKVIQRCINSNLEFIVDQKMVETTESVLYQKNLLQFQAHQVIQFTNSYNASEIKNRILQINSKKSTRMKKLKFLLATPILVVFFAMFQVETVAQVKEAKNIDKTKNSKHIEEETGEDKQLNNNELSKKQKDFFMLLETVEKDLDVLKNDRKTFDNIASKFPIVVDGILMGKKELENFDTSRIKSIHIDAGNPDIGTFVNLSTNTENSNSRMFTFKIANDNSQSGNNKTSKGIFINGKDSTEEELTNHINKINQQKKDSLSSANKVQIQKTNDNDSHLTIKGTHVTIKGIGISSNKKIVYIVDGEEIRNEDFGKIHPDDIDRIDILKDKKALEKYGDKALDGVILITTKTKKEISLQKYKEALKARELAKKKRNEVVAERKEILLQNRKAREKSRQQLIKKRKEISEKTQQRRAELKVEREKILAKRKETIVVSNKQSDQKLINEDYKILTDIFNEVNKTVKENEDENFKITSVRASITREDGTKVELSEVY